MPSRNRYGQDSGMDGDALEDQTRVLYNDGVLTPTNDLADVRSEDNMMRRTIDLIPANAPPFTQLPPTQVQSPTLLKALPAPS